MSSSYEKSVKGATKVKLAPPKAKYIEHILQATHTGEAGVAEVFRTLQFRLRDSTWTIAFKALIVVHLMIRDGEPDVTLKYLSQSPSKALGVNTYTEVQTQGRNIMTYSRYLVERARSYGKTRSDFIGGRPGRLKRLSVDKGLLRETESVQEQINALVKCDMFVDEPENEISLTAFRALTQDLLVLFQVMNEGTINILEHYFEMSRPDAERALAIYQTFAKQTDQVVKFLSMARQYEYVTRLEIPKIKHAPTSLAASLEDYLSDKDFEVNRRQYLAQQDAKKGSKGPASGGIAVGTKTAPNASQLSSSQPQVTNAPQTQAKGPAPDLIDFFESIEDKQQPLGQQAQQFQQQPAFNSQYQTYPQQTGFADQTNPFAHNQPTQFQTPQQTNAFGQYQQQPFPEQQQFQQQQQQHPQQSHIQQAQLQTQAPQLQSQFTGAGFGGYTPQPQQSNQQQPQFESHNAIANNTGFAQYPQQIWQSNQAQTTNPFRQSTLPPSATGQQTLFGSDNQGLVASQTGANPFARMNSTSQGSFGQGQQGLIPQRTGTNPFAREQQSSQPPATLSPPPIQSSPTGSTNPFRQSAFINQQTGQGWTGSQGTMGGLEQLQTMPVFPRPGQPQGQPGPW